MKPGGENLFAIRATFFSAGPVERRVYVQMEEVTNRWAKLKLSEREGCEVDLATPGVDQGLVLAGKFCTKRRVNLEAIGRALRTVWRTKRDFEVSDLGENRVLMIFQEKEDLDRVLLQGPWSFDKYILLLHKLELGESLQNLTFKDAAFWVQIHGLPTLSQTREAGLRIGGSLGKVDKVDVGDKGLSMGCYLRIRVILDITQPLSRGRIVRLGGSEPRWVEFKYERLPVFCYFCGKLDHDEKECLEWMRSEGPIRAEEKQYGPWLRATIDRLQKPHVVLGQQYRENASLGRRGARSPDQNAHLRQQTVAVDERGEPQRAAETNLGRADVESRKMDSECFKEKLTEGKEKPDFEEQLREIDAEISGLADTGCITEKVRTVRDLVSEVQMSANQTDEKGREDVLGGHAEKTFTEKELCGELKVPESKKKDKAKGDILDGPRSGPQSIGLKEEMGRVAANGPKGTNKIQMQAMDMKGDQVGLNKSCITEIDPNKVNLSPIRGMSHAHASKSEEEYVELVLAKGRKKKNTRETNRMEVEEEYAGVKRKTRTPTEERMENVEVRKKPKIDAEVEAFGKMLAMQLGSAAAAVQPRREQ